MDLSRVSDWRVGSSEHVMISNRNFSSMQRFRFESDPQSLGALAFDRRDVFVEVRSCVVTLCHIKVVGMKNSLASFRIGEDNETGFARSMTGVRST